MAHSREYHSPIRDAQAEATRQRVLDAAIDLLVEEGPHALGQRAIARRAGLSAPTVARHLPDAESIVAGIDERLTERLGTGEAARNPEELFGKLLAIYQGLDREERATRAYLAAPMSRAYGLERRREMIADAFGPALAGLSPGDRLRVLSVLQLFVSAQTWMHLRDVWGIAGKEAALTAHWAMRTLFEAALRRPPSEVPLPAEDEDPLAPTPPGPPNRREEP